LWVICSHMCRLKQQDDFDVDPADVTDIACFALADGIGGDGRCGNSVRTLCQRTVNCAARRKMASSSSVESRDLSPYEAAASSSFPGELHGRFRSIPAGGGYPASLSASGGPAAAGYACMTLLSPERDCSPDPELQPVGGSCRCEGDATLGTTRNCRCGAGHYGCRMVGVDRKPGSCRRCPAPSSADTAAHAAHCGGGGGNAVVYTCSKHGNITLAGSGDGAVTTLQCRSQHMQRRCKETDDNAAKTSIEIGDVF
jgi:hypothetical protein